MLPALDGLLAGEEWRRWEDDLRRLWYEEAEVEQLVEECRGWQQQRQAASEERKRAAAAA
jgi:hypothetical protein